jgi:acyl carrier protein phosphodiesterase
MNYLAHTLLSGKNENLIVGNFLADIVRKNEYNIISDQYNIGFELHRAIDSFTDEHESVKNVTKLLRTNHKKYAPVVTDILLDYILGQCWYSYSNENIQVFADIRYDIIRMHLPYFPERVKPIIAKMLDGNFLIKYTTIDGLMFTFEKIQEVARFPSDFTQAVEDLEDNMEVLYKEFNVFFPELVSHTEHFRSAAK